jgi:hypothetical protein
MNAVKELMEKEIKDFNEWATAFYINDDGKLIYINHKFMSTSKNYD